MFPLLEAVQLELKALRGCSQRCDSAEGLGHVQQHKHHHYEPEAIELVPGQHRRRHPQGEDQFESRPLQLGRARSASRSGTGRRTGSMEFINKVVESITEEFGRSRGPRC